MKTTTKKRIEISEQMYSSTSNFVWQNGLEKEAQELFGKDWENEDDCNQIEQLLEFINKPFYEVEFIEGLKSNEDIKVWFNAMAFELDKYKRAYEEVMCYFDSISDEEQPKLLKRLTEIGL